MGYGGYSYSDRRTRAFTAGYHEKPKEEIFKQRSINNAMSPEGVGIRESRDSEEHPNSLAIIIALDVTGSMGSVPHYLIKDGLPDIMDTIIKMGIADPQVLFLGIGDHTCDQAPLQVSQFESGDELLDKWLETIWLEGMGGRNDGESYMLAWYFAAFHTAIDCMEKRNQKGILITIGDEPVLRNIPVKSLCEIMGDKSGQYLQTQEGKISSDDLLKAAREKYEVFHINIKETGSGSRISVSDGWEQLLRDGFQNCQSRSHVAELIASLVVKCAKAIDITTTPQQDEKVATDETDATPDQASESIML